MRFGFIILVFFSTSVLGFQKDDLEYSWARFSSSDERNFLRLIKILEKSKKGAQVIRAAQAKAAFSGKTLLDVIRVGENSLTDTSIIRKFSKNNALYAVHESRTHVYINRNLSTYDAILDLAHELIHFVYREDFNPYHDKFKLEDFIKSTIEGRGGEVEAYIVECEINKELFAELNLKRTGCQDVWDSSEKIFSASKAQELFYNMGIYYHKFKFEFYKITTSNHELGYYFPEMSKSQVRFFSSAHSVPYPVAAIYEYQAIVGAACRNDEKRLHHIQSSLSLKNHPQDFHKVSEFKKSYKSRCHKFIQKKHE